MPRRGRTRKGRSRAGLLRAEPLARPLLRATDHGDAITIHAKDVGAAGDRWAEPFLSANAAGLQRLELQSQIRLAPDLQVILSPRSRIGAVPLLSPATRKVAAGLLIEPRFRWTALGAVFNAIGFSVEPVLGGAPLVPGSARDVPPWMLAGPVIERLAAMLHNRKRAFTERREIRSSPRGRIEWSTWATAQLPRGAWAAYPCTFSEPDDDPDVIAAVRWTLSRLEEELSTVASSPPGRILLRRAAQLQAVIGPGAQKRPLTLQWSSVAGSEWVMKAVEAMTWVAEERGLGGARNLDGLAWDLSIDEVWEAWVVAFSIELGRRIGMVPSPFQASRRPLRWDGPCHSMGALIPDAELRAANRVVWIDAKYKAHLELLARKGWQGLPDDVREQHRADLHQALAYASLADAPTVDTLLLYPQMGSGSLSPSTIATVTSGRRRVRLILASLPFGYRSPEHQERCLEIFRNLLAA